MGCLSAYQFTVKYRSTKKHGNADVLSRFHFPRLMMVVLWKWMICKLVKLLVCLVCTGLIRIPC